MTHDAETDPGLIRALTTDLERRVNAKLANARFEIWRDKQGLRTGERWNSKIEVELRRVDVLIVLLTPRWIESEYCQMEYSVFRKAEALRAVGEYVVPILARSIDHQARHFTGAQREIYTSISQRQFFKAMASNFLRLPLARRNSAIDAIADDIIGMTERLRDRPVFLSESPVPPRGDKVGRSQEESNPLEHHSMDSVYQEPFYNKIFSCDIVGYLTRNALEQYAYQRTLNRLLLSVVGKLGLKFDKDVVALPTIHGVVLNFLASEADIYLRAAMQVLEDLYLGDTSTEMPLELRIGLNSHVDTLAVDMNNRINVVGSGISMAQHVMNLGRHAQILMHDRVKLDLEDYAEYVPKLVSRGVYPVGHGKQIPIAQYVDPMCSYLCNDLVQLPLLPEASQINLETILQHDNKNNLLSVSLDHRGRDHLNEIREYFEEFLDANDEFQRLRISVPWAANEMLRNAFAYGNIATDDHIVLRVRRTRSGISVELEQPDVADFQIEAILRDQRHADSFMQIMHQRGWMWHQRRTDNRLVLGLEIPNNLNIMPMQGLTFDPEGGAPLDLPTPVAAFLDGVIDNRVHGGLLLIRLLSSRLDNVSGPLTEQLLCGLIESSPTPRGAIVDLSRVDYAVSIGLRALLHAHRVAARNNCVCASRCKSNSK